MKKLITNKFFRSQCSSISAAVDFRPLNEVPNVQLLKLIKDVILSRFKEDSKNSTKLFSCSALSSKYGPFFSLNVFGHKIFLTTDAENAHKIFRNEGKYPFRETFPALYNYIDEKLDCHSVVTSSGPEWYRLRKALEPVFSENTTSKYLEIHEELAKAFVLQIKESRDENFVLNDVFTSSRMNGFEMGTQTFFGVRVTDPEYALKVLDGSMKFLDGVNETTFELPIWNLYKTAKYQRFESGFDTLIECAENMAAKTKTLSNHVEPLAALIRQDGNVSDKELKLFIAESLCQTIDAIPLSVTMSLYFLSKDAQRQETALKDIQQNSNKYLKACIKESLRLAHYGGELSRKLPYDTIMNNYLIPAETQVVFYSPVSSKMDVYFDDANSFMPERWIRNEDGKLYKKHECSNIASLPFGLGKRICLGRYLTYQYATCILKEVIKSFHLECCTDSQVQMERVFVRKPDRNVNIRFTDRKKN